MRTYRVSVGVNPNETQFCAYGGHCIELALDRASQYDFANVVTVEYKHEDGTWRVVTSREGVSHGIPDEVDGVYDYVGSARHDSRLGY